MAESSRRRKRNNRINHLGEADEDHGHCFNTSEIINTPGFEGLKEVLEGKKVDYFYYNGQKMIPFNDLEVDLFSGDHHMNQQVHPPQNEGGNESPPASTNTSSQSSQKDDEEIVSDSVPNTTIGAELNSTERASDLLPEVTLNGEPTRRKILKLAYSAMEELAKIAFVGKPLWKTPEKEKYETLDDIEYLREFGHVEATLQDIIDMVEDGETQFQQKNASKMAVPSEVLHIEASRDIAYVKMSPIKIVEMLMDLKQWSEVFCNIVSRAKIIGILSNGAEAEGSFDGRVQVMSSEFHLPTALVPCRECYFARYCKKLSDTKWGVVDVSLEKILPHPLNNYQRRPSGCIIEEMPEGHTKVTWVEHGQADYRELNINFERIITSGFAFSATRWVAYIVRHCEAHEILKAGVVNSNNISKGGRESMWKMGERAMRNFCEDMNGSPENQWMKMQLRQLPLRSNRVHHQYRFKFEEEVKDVRLCVKDNTILKEAGKPCDTSVTFSTSLCLPVSPTRLFHFLSDHRSRPKWDLLLTTQGLRTREHAYLIKGKDPANRVSILELADARGKIDIHYLQESYTDISGSYVVYAPLDEHAFSDVLEGEKNPDFIPILPSGFAILPWRIHKDGDSTASVLTVGFHLLDYRSSKSYLSPRSVATMHKILRAAVTGIKDAVFSNNLLDY